MPAHLECLTPPFAGRVLTITPGKPVVIKTNKAEEDVGEVRVEVVDGELVLVNCSRMACAVNGIAQTRAALVHGDLIAIGKQTFRLHAEDDGIGTDELAPVEIVDAEAALCSVCDQPFDAADAAGGWSADGQRICRRCLSKGVKPDNLPRPAPEPVYYDGPAGAEAATAANLPPPGEEADAPPPEAVEPPAPSDSDRQRRQRRLSASRLAQIDPPAAKPGLLSKVGAVFAGREERRRLEVLEGERRGLLEEAGRLALTENNGFGVPEHLVGPLLKGVEVRLRLQDFSIPALERWRGLRQRLALLDAEIAVLRSSLALGPDPALALPPQPLRADERERQDRTFKLLDAMATEDLAPAVEDPGFEPAPPPAPVPRPAATSDRQRAVSGRRPGVRKHRR